MRTQIPQVSILLVPSKIHLTKDFHTWIASFPFRKKYLCVPKISTMNHLSVRFSLLFLFIVSTFITGCFSYEEVEMLGVENVEMVNLSDKEVEVEVTVKLKNPNNYKISIVGSDLDMYLNGTAMGKATLKNNVVIPKNSNQSHKIRISADPKALMSNPLGAIMGLLGKPLEVGVKGKVKVKAKFITKKFDIDVKERVKM